MMLHEVWLAREKRRANQIACKFHFSAFDVIMKKVYVPHRKNSLELINLSSINKIY